MSDPTGPTRRDALRVGALVGVSGGLSALLGGLPRTGSAAEPRAPVAYDLNDPKAQVASTCAGCTGACPVRATRSTGIVAKIDGSPWTPRQGGDPVPRDAVHAASLRGATCARGQARVNNAHDPWRLVRPLVRDGARGSMRFRTADGEAWLRELVDGGDAPGLRGIEAGLRGAPAGAAPGLVIAVDPRQADRRAALDAFAAGFAGTRTILGHPAAALARATDTVLGTPGRIAAPRWERATLRVAWGSDPMASGIDPVGTMRALAGDRARLIAVDPRLSSTAGMAGKWLPVKPGSDALLVAWLLRILDADLPVAARLPADDPVRALPTAELERGLGVGAELVELLAARMRDAGPGLAVAVGGGLDPRTTTAVLGLCAALGALGPGGAMAPAIDPIPRQDAGAALVEALRAEPAPRAVIVVGDPGLSGSARLPEVLALLGDPARIPRVVLVDVAPGPLLAVADLVLPDVTELERIGLVRRHDGTSVVLPAIDPVQAAAFDGPLAHGLEGLLGEVAVACGLPAPDPGFAAAVNAAAAGLPPISDADDAVLAAALEGRVPLDGIDARGRSLLLRGHAPPPAAPEAPAPIVAFHPVTLPEPVDGVALVSWTEIFGGQADSGAQVWAAGAVRDGNVAQLHPDTIAGIPGDPTGHLEVRAGDVAVTLPAEPTRALRPGVVAIARGYGHPTGYDGGWVVDGTPIEGSPRRCAGAPVEFLRAAGGPVTLTWVAPPPRPGLFARLMPGGAR